MSEDLAALRAEIGPQVVIRELEMLTTDDLKRVHAKGLDKLWEVVEDPPLAAEPDPDRTSPRPARRADRGVGARQRRVLRRVHRQGEAPAQALQLLDRSGAYTDLAVRTRAASLLWMTQVAVVPGAYLEAASLATQVGLARHDRLNALSALFITRHLVNGTSREQVAAAVLDSYPAVDRGDAADLLAQGAAHLVLGSFAKAMPLLRTALRELCGGGPLTEVPGFYMLGVFAAHAAWDDRAMTAWMDRVTRAATDRGALLALGATLKFRTGWEALAGRFTEAENAYGVANEIYYAAGIPTDRTERTGDALILAWRGMDDAARAAISDTAKLQLALSSGAGYALARRAALVLDLAVGNYSAALATAMELSGPELLPYDQTILPDLIEAAVRAGAPEAAGEALRQLTASAMASGTPWALGMLARARALLTADGEELYSESIDLLARTSLTSEQARARLLYGEWLRRRLRRHDAREQLRAAYEAFQSMGAEAFAKRAGRELLATGEQVRRRPQPDSDGLTNQERNVAELAAVPGIRNKDIAARLFLSVGTVEYHLNKVFRKLGVASRRELAARLGERS